MKKKDIFWPKFGLIALIIILTILAFVCDDLTLTLCYVLSYGSLGSLLIFRIIGLRLRPSIEYALASGLPFGIAPISKFLLKWSGLFAGSFLACGVILVLFSIFEITPGRLLENESTGSCPCEK